MLRDFDTKFYKQLFILTLPLVLQQLLRISVDTVNSILLGSIDQIQMSAVSQANQIFFIFYTLLSGLSTGACVLVAQYWGKHDEESIKTITATALRFALYIGVVFTLLVFLFPGVFIRIYSSDAEIIALGASYLRKVVWMYAAAGISLTIFGAARGIGNVQQILMTNVISYSVNIILDYMLIFGKFGLPAMGITGVAIGTIVARFTELIVISIFFTRDKKLNFRLSDLSRKDATLQKDFINVSKPLVAHELIWSLGTSTGAMITGQLGSSVVGGYNVTTVLADLTNSFGNGMLAAVNITIGNMIGAGKIDKVKKESRVLLVLSAIIGMCIGVITMLVRDPFISLYALTPEALAYARQFITVIALIAPFQALEMVGMIGILRAGGDARTGFITDIFVMWCLCIPLAAIEAFVLHVEPVYIVATIKFIIVLEGVVGVIRVLSMKWIHDLTHD